MKTVKHFLSDLTSLDIQVCLDGTNLRCNSPKGVITPEIRTKLANHKAEIITYLQQQAKENKIIHVNRDNNLPLSSAQARLLFLEQLEEGKSTNYTIINHFKFVGDLNVAALEKSLLKIVKRHEILRTNFIKFNQLPIQNIRSNFIFYLPVIDLINFSRTQQQSEIERLIDEDIQKNFDLEHDWLIRTNLLQVEAESYIFLLTFHHIVFDAWSAGIFFKELSSLYQFYLNRDTVGNVSTPLPELPIQYADFAVWQKQWLSDVLNTQLDYWKKQLANLPSFLELPTNKPHYSAELSRGCRQTFPLTIELTQKLRDLSRQSGTTMFMTLLAGFATLLHHYSAQEDIVIGSPIANRNHREIESLIGFFVNTIVLRINVENNPTFVELLKRVRQVTLEANEYQDLPFEKLVEELKPVRDSSHSPLFQVMFFAQKELVEELELPGITVTPYSVSHVTETFDLSLYMSETQTGIEGYWEYDSELFEQQTVERMARHLQTLLESIVEHPEKRLSELSVLSQSEQNQILVEWNLSQLEVPTDQCIHQLFAQLAAFTPDAIALVYENQQLTYRELNSRANQLGQYLQSLGVKPEVLVSICVERSIEMIVGFLGILKAGGAYIPLDPRLPQQRLSYIIEDTQTDILLTQASLVTKLPECGKTICLDSQWGLISQRTTENPRTGVKPNNLAYIIYTSGSTGKPKGVMIEHRSLMNFTLVAAKEYGITNDDRVLQFASPSFDTAVEEIYPTLTVGGTLVLRTEQMLLSDDEFWQHCREWRISVLNFPTAYWHQLTTQLSPLDKRIPEHLRLVIIGGEEAKLEQVKRWYQGIGHLHNLPKLVNSYGPTEATVSSTLYWLNSTPEISVPIGRPMSNTQVYVLSKAQKPVPIGVSGELHIGGAGLARGYWHHQELTEHSFIPNPFPGSKSPYLYKTGDLVRYRADAQIEFLGRMDDQVKIRGFRIELGEIETVLMQHPQLQAALVTVRSEQPGDKRLIAYIIPRSNQLTYHDLRQYLALQLPHYMLPSAWVMLDAFPLTPNGKIDYLALSTPTQQQSYNTISILPRTPTQELIADIIAIVLKQERVGIYDNFFELGGHSLLATQVISRLRETFKVEIPLRCLFESPSVAELEKVILKEQLEGRQQISSGIVPMSENTVDVPLSFAQSRLWFLDQLQGMTSTYNVADAIEMTGNLNVTALEQAIQEIVHRHAILRTNFKSVNGFPVQIIHPNARLTLSVVDFPGDLLAVEQQLQHLVTLEAQQPFNLQQEVLVRTKLWRLNSEKHVLLLVMHHIVCDGWSMGIFFQELSVLYQALNTGNALPLPELPIQYADYAVWQQKWLQELEAHSHSPLQNQINYWQQQLANAPPLLELPTDKPRKAMQTFRGSYVEFKLDADLSRQMKILSQQSGTTLFMTLLAGFATLLFRYTAQDDILIGSPVANRNRQEIESLIGFFVNTLVLRTKIQRHCQFKELLTQVRQVALGAFAHQDIPFEKIVEILQPERDLSHNPLFQVMFDLEIVATEQLELLGLQLKPFSISNNTSKFDLSLVMRETQAGLEGYWEYNSDLFEHQTIVRMASNFSTLLSDIAANPEKPVGELSLLTEQELHHLLVEWNNTDTPYPDSKCIHQVFEEQVEQTPFSVAVVYEDQSLTYHELNLRANKIAHYLQTLGVGPEVLVGICVERSVEMVIGLLGILKAGGAYVPLDPEYPIARLSFMLLDAQVSVLLTQQRLVKRLPEHGSYIVSLDTDWQVISQSPQDNPIAGVQASNLAYVIYTSGSTGKPKGAMNTHRSICNRLLWMQQAYQLTASDAVLQKTTFCFDVSVWEFFWTLITGARLVIAKPEGHKDSEYLFNLIAKENITTLHFVPSMLQVFLEALGVEKLKSLKRVICSGEALPFALEHCFFKLVDAELHNLYGPTEAAIDVTFWKCQRDDKSIVPIGRPISNTQIYLLDAHLEPVPIGVPGELHIGGAGLGRGYLNRPELTLEKFIPNPFGTDGHSRLYKTGDLAKYLPSGNIEYLGRIDNQVKIRGFRIELGEIETVLSQHPSVHSVVVTARVDTPGAQRLVAYIVPKQQKAPTISELRQFLKTKLPEYMVPSAFVILKALPLTPNGKVDRRALPAPELDRELLDLFVAPRTPIEEILVLVWALVLKVEQVGIYDNFFELGGHSLLATQVISRLREAFQVELPLRCLFESPTVAQLEKAIAAYRQTDSTLIPRAIKPISGNAKTFPLSFAQLRLWFLEQLEENNAVYNIPFAFQLCGNLNIAILEEAIQKVVQRHAVLRTNFPTIQDTPIQIIHPTVKVSLPIVNLQHLPNPKGEAQKLATLVAEKRFDLTQDILVRTTLLCLSDQKYVLLLTLHHIVSDGWSMGIFLQEVSTLYKVLLTNQPSPLPTLEIQYADYAVWQQQWLQELGSNDYSLLQNQLNYWKQQLSGTAPLLELPISKPRPTVQKFRGRSCQFKLNADLTKQISYLSRSCGATLFMTLLAAFVTLLHRYSGQEDILVGSPIANRHYREIEPLIGLFVNTLVLRTKIQDNPNFLDLLQQVRQTALDAYMHQDVPFEQVVEVLQPERSLSYNPLFQVMFALQNIPENDLDLPGVTISTLPTETTNTQFDLTLTLVEKEQELYGEWEYDSELFEQQTVERMARHLQTLLESIVEHPEKRLSELSVLSQSEQNQILVEWNLSQLEVPTDQCIHQLFAQLAAFTPDAIALVYENQQLTYRELNSRANQLGQYLQSLGVKPEVLVSICVERSIEMIVGFLGILKAGGAYIPLDPRLPQQRLSYIIEDTQTDILLTQASLVTKLPECGKTICLDSQWGLINQRTTENPRTGVKPNNLAYIIYTSGSTGKPKGVIIEHRSLMNFTLVAAKEYGITNDDRVLQFASPSFDTAVEEIYPTLTVGGTLVLRTEQMLLSDDEFWQHCREWRISVLNFPTAYWHQLTTQLSPLDKRIPEHLRLVIIGGEEATLEQVKRWYQGIGHLHNLPKLVNSYGPTEATVTSTLYWIHSTPEISVPIGRPMSNTQVYVLDKYQQPVPIGVEGELYIGGSGLARGYWHQQELTQQKFIPNPFPGSQSPYLYKTGDKVRYRADGNIEFLGRLDNQVKIRGFRIELSEIETVLMQHPQLQAALVTVRSEQPGDKRLIAYIIPSSHQPIHHDLRQYLTQQLPHYMVPSAWVMLDAFPLTPNGKIDYLALPIVEANTSQRTEIISPRDKVELHLTKIWSEVLNIYPVGVSDNFFDLGGHSLLTVSLMTKIQHQIGTKLPISTIFQNGTIEQQATLLRQQTTVQTWSPLVAIQPHGTKPPLFCVHPGGGSVINYVYLANALGSDQPFYGLEALGFDEGQQPQNRVEQMATDYIKALQTIQPHGPYFLAAWCFGCLVAFEMATQLQTQGEKISFLGFLDIYDFSIDETLSDDLSLFMSFFGEHLTVSSTHLKQLDSNQQLTYALEQAKQLKLIPPDFQLAQVHRLLNVAKSHDIAIANYLPQHYKGQITLFQALEGIAATSNNPTQDWENLADNVELHWVPGDHRTMLISPHVQILAEKLQMCIKQAKLNIV